MMKFFTRYIWLSFSVFLFTQPGFGETVVFFDVHFPAVENSFITRESLERALAPPKPRFVGLDSLQKKNALAEGDLLVLPYGSAFPADAWNVIQQHLERGNLHREQQLVVR